MITGGAIAALLETARIFSTQQAASTTPKGLKIVFFDQEERQLDGSGLLGSLAFTEVAENIANVKGAVILDMIGYACRTPGCQNYPQNLPIPNVPDTGEFLAVLGLENHTNLIGARVGGSVLPGPAGSLARATIGELSSNSAANGNIRLSAAQAVRVAKTC